MPVSSCGCEAFNLLNAGCSPRNSPSKRPFDPVPDVVKNKPRYMSSIKRCFGKPVVGIVLDDTKASRRAKSQ
jgi:hypothetical protein